MKNKNQDFPETKVAYILGVDIGGTNTDAVLVDGSNKICAAKKVLTTQSIEEGFQEVLKEILTKSNVAAESITGVFVGTTHATNALLQKRDLYSVGVIRLSGKTGQCLPPCYGWPVDMQEGILSGYEIINGGFECDGREIGKIDHQEVISALDKLIEKGMESLCVVGVFSPLKPEQENEVFEIAKKHLGSDFPITLSYKIGGVGLINRENAAILNAALKRSMQNGFNALKHGMRKLGLYCPLHLTQNNGTIISLEEALEYPVLTISAGPTNSFIGSAKISGLNNAVVVDVGGTSTDVGIVIKGLPRRSVDSSSIGGVSLNFPMPDVLSIGLGGGSYVSLKKDSDGKTYVDSIGPRSAGKNLKVEGKSFGGPQITLTDAALSLGLVEIDGAQKQNINLDGDQQNLAQEVVDQALVKILDLTRIMKGVHKNWPVILTGGGSAIFKQSAEKGVFIIPENASVANAYGAALADISGSIDTVVCMDKRDEVLAEIEAKAKALAVSLGADKKALKVVSLEIIPYHYVPQNLARVKMTVAGKRSF